MVKTISEALSYGCEQLKISNIESFLSDSLILLCHTLSCDKTYLIVNKNQAVSPEDFLKYSEYIKLRKENMPVKYITGICEFMSLDFIVNKHVLIPRTDTEILVEEVLKRNESSKKLKILDLCCGSGCIGISLAHYFKNSIVTLVDISEEALKVTEQNISKHNLSHRVSALKRDILSQGVDGSFDIIVSNPPYINDEDYERLEPDVKLYEPKGALLSEKDEYKFYKRIIDDFSPLLEENGQMYLEMGYNQSAFLEKYMRKSNKFSNIEIIKDFGGINRVLRGELCKRN